jgi:hypothetical protein
MLIQCVEDVLRHAAHPPLSEGRTA